METAISVIVPVYLSAADGVRTGRSILETLCRAPERWRFTRRPACTDGE